MLVSGVANPRAPDRARIYFLRSIPRDPFAPEGLQPNAATWELRSYASPPEAPAPGVDVFDIHTHAQGVGLNGVAYRDW